MAKLREAKSAYTKELNRHNPGPLSIRGLLATEPASTLLFLKERICRQIN